MAKSLVNDVLAHVRQMAGEAAAARTDGELLGSFVRQRDDAALTGLIERHGPMVWGVCRRLLREQADAEDAFQATFLVLVQKAATIRDRPAVGNWLYGVARQTAGRLRCNLARLHRRELQMAELPQRATQAAPCGDEVLGLLDEEVGRLPQKYRVLVVLCDLEGRTRKDVARQLGCPEGTVAGRLARARALLARRLARRGVALSAGAVLSQQGASAATPAAVVFSTVKAASLVAAGQAAGLVSARVAALTHGVLKTMLLSKVKALMVVLATAALVGVAGLLYQTQAAPPGEQCPGARRDGDPPGGQAGRPPIKAPARDFEFHKKVAPSRLKIELSSSSMVRERAPFRRGGRRTNQTKPGLVLALTITNTSARKIVAKLAHEWHGGEWPTTALYASVTPAGDRQVKPFAPVYLAGEDQRAARRVSLAAGKSLDVSLRVDWPGTGSVPARPLIGKPGSYTVRFALVFEADGKRQYACTPPVTVEYQPGSVEQFGNAPAPAVKRPEWAEEVLDVVHLRSRVYSQWSDGNEQFYYRGDALALREALRKFAAVKAEARRVILLPGRGSASTLGGLTVPCDWKLYVPSGIHRAVSGNKHAVMTVYVSASKPRGKLDRRQVARWLDELDSDSFEARQQAERELAKLGADVKALLHKALGGRPGLEVRRRIERLLRRLPGLDVGDLEVPGGLSVVSIDELLAEHLHGLKHTSAGVRRDAISALTNLAPCSDKVVPALIGHLEKEKDSHLRQLAAVCLGGLGVRARPARQVLQKGLHDPDPDVRTACKDALRWIEEARRDPAAEAEVKRKRAILNDINEWKKQSLRQ
jgi:RNA polymerase sigma factor (sigma-70 family)